MYTGRKKELGIWKLNLKPSYHLVRVMEVCTWYFGGIVEGNYPIDQSQHALQEIRRRMKGSRFANDCCGRSDHEFEDSAKVFRQRNVKRETLS